MTPKELQALEEGKKNTFLSKINSWFTPTEAAKGLCSIKDTKKFIETMKPMIQAAFLEVAPMAQSRIVELLYWTKEVLDRDWNVQTLKDWDLSLKAAELLLKHAWLWQKESIEVKVWPKKATLMDAIDWELED